MATTDNMTPRHLLTAANANARRLATLAALTADLAAAREPRAVLERAVVAAAELLEAHTAAAFLRRADGHGFDVAAARGLAPLEPGARALRGSEARLTLQYEVASVLARSTTLHDAIPALLQTICDQLHWNVGAFWLVDRRDNVLRCRDIWHRPAVDIPGFEARSRQSAFP